MESGVDMSLQLQYPSTIRPDLAPPACRPGPEAGDDQAGASWERKMDEGTEMGSPVKNWWDDNALNRVNAVVIILGCTLAGTTYRTHKQRLLDVLNRSIVANLHRIGREFLPLTDVEAFFSTGEKESLASTHINKSSILFVAERSGGRPARDGVPEAEANLLRAKGALPSRVDIPPYILYGNMYSEMGQGLVHVIDGEDTFLPMTDVSISPPLPTGEWKFGFVAINKHQIVRVEESQGVPEPPPPAPRKVRRRKPKAAAPMPSDPVPPAAAAGSPLTIPDSDGS